MLSMIKAETKATPVLLDVETLNAIALRLDERADAIRQVTLVDLVADIRIASRACEVLAHVRFALGEIAEKTKDHDTRLEIRGLLDDASVAEPQVGQP
jgi:hypothetical protein